MTMDQQVEAIEAARVLIHFSAGFIKQSTVFAVGAVDVVLQTVLAVTDVTLGVAGEFVEAIGVKE